MIPAWIQRGDDKWEPCWLISTSPHGSSDDYVMIATDDNPQGSKPPGSLYLKTVSMRFVRIRRTVIPLLDPTPTWG